MSDKVMRRWQVATMVGVVVVWASSEAQARSRGKWKAVHQACVFRNRADEMAAVRDCEVSWIRQLV